MVTPKNLSVTGAALIIVGLFCPIVMLPMVGNVNLFNDGSNILALALLALAGIAGAMAVNNRERDAMWPGIGAAAVLAYHFINLQYRLSQIRASMDDLAGNPFAGLAKAATGSIQLQWGWLVLAAGAGLLIYAGLRSSREDDAPALWPSDSASKTVAAVSIILGIGVIGWSISSGFRSSEVAEAVAGTGDSSTGVDLPGPLSSVTTPEGPSAEEAAYINQHLRLYDLEAKYYDSMLDGRVPGVDFKIKNGGNRTLHQVTVRVVFRDAAGNAIAEEEYNPVIVSEYSFGDVNRPLRPNYIWQNEAGRFYSAKKVPSEWAEGKATASIIDIEFGPNE